MRTLRTFQRLEVYAAGFSNCWKQVFVTLALLLPLMHANAAVENLEAFGRIPVQDGGRIMPLDSCAREHLLALSGRSSSGGRPAIVWLAQIMFEPESVATNALFLVNNPEVIESLGLEAHGRARYSIAQLQPHLNDLLKLAKSAFTIESDSRSSVEKELIQLAGSVSVFMRLTRGSLPALVPLPGHADGTWAGALEIGKIGSSDAAVQAEITAIDEMRASYRDGKQASFDAACHTLSDSVATRALTDKQRRNLSLEVTYNRADTFYRAELLYGFAFLVALASVAWRSRWTYRAAAILIVVALIPHTWGIVTRMLIMGRPPVTNLYATFLFVAWVCVLLGLAVEFFQRNRIGLMTAAASGVALLMTSARFAAEGDTMGVMIAVLDSNFWLSTHVVCITIGYAGTCVAGLLGHLYLLQALRRRPDDPGLRETGNAVFGALGFGLIFSFLGTMLGGVWADQSWGRFWGWDPKENGALVIVLWSAIVFHARIAGYIGMRGFAAGCVIGVIGVLMAWLGVNLLGVGLHSYGFTTAMQRGFVASCIIEVLFVLLVTPFAKKSAPASA